MSLVEWKAATSGDPTQFNRTVAMMMMMRIMIMMMTMMMRKEINTIASIDKLGSPSGNGAGSREDDLVMKV